MKILWISNVLFPDISKRLGIKETNFGGWMHSACNKYLELFNEDEMAVASCGNSEFFEEKINNIHYFVIPFKLGQTTYISSMEEYWKLIIENYKPDIVHIHGTEFTHGLAFLRLYPNIKTVISIQGMVSVCARYFNGGIDKTQLYKKLPFYDRLRKNFYNEIDSYKKRGEFEKEMIQRCENIIGRTFWDYSHCFVINSNIKYFKCNETLRESFYHHTWQYEKCERNSIFLSTGGYPLKGFHKFVEALIIIKKHIPDIKVYVGGSNEYFKTDWKSLIRKSLYFKYIEKLITDYGLNDNISFTGSLNEESMVKQFLKCNLFVCPSSIENSSNSVGEAQLLGVPCVASYVGGMADLIEDGKTGFLYRFEEIEMLACRIIKLLGDRQLQESISRESRLIAAQRHDPDTNAINLHYIYNEIIKKK